MQNNQSFTLYKKLKQKIDFVYRGVYINRVLALQCWDWANNYKFELRQLSCFYKAYDFGFLKQIDSENVIYTDITRRKDHEATFLNIAQKVEDRYCIINKSSGIDRVSHFNFYNILRAIWHVFTTMRLGPFSKRLSIGGEICMIMNTIDALYDLHLPQIRCFTAYSIIHKTQNLLGQFFKTQNVKVIGLTHGVQIIYHKNVPIDALNYENLSAKCLVWGQMTKDEYMSYGIDERSLFVAGYPKNMTIRGVNKDNKMKNCLVLLCRNTYDNSNIRLLNILSNFSERYKFHVKLHPSCDFEQYDNECSIRGFQLIPKDVSLLDCMDNSKYDFSIAVNTSSYYEIQAAGIPCLRYDDGSTYDLPKGNDNDRVANAKEFENAIKWLAERIEGGEIDSIIREALSYNLGYGIDKYREFLLD